MWGELLSGLGGLFSSGAGEALGGGLASGAGSLFGAPSSGSSLGSLGSLGSSGAGAATGMPSGAFNMFGAGGAPRGLFEGRGDSLMSAGDIGSGAMSEEGLLKEPELPGTSNPLYIPDTPEAIPAPALPDAMGQLRGLMAMMPQQQQQRPRELQQMSGGLMDYLQQLSMR